MNIKYQVINIKQHKISQPYQFHETVNCFPRGEPIVLVQRTWRSYGIMQTPVYVQGLLSLQWMAILVVLFTVRESCNVER